MSAELLVPGVYRVSLGMVNAYLLVDEQAVTVIDSGIPGSAPKIMEAVCSLGKGPQDVKHILLTHLHADHTGSAKALKDITGAPIYMHPLDAQYFEKGLVMRPVKPAPGLVNRVVGSLLVRRSPDPVEGTTVDCRISDGETLPIAGGLQVIHAPGHAAGQVVFLWPQAGGVLFAADACTNLIRLGYPPIFEDLEAGKQSLRKLAGLRFEHAAFGHGRPLHGADEQFRNKWG
jgi:glyoxylase-like metal-dependent hydrolase (beta-lactamase superfamily II)